VLALGRVLAVVSVWALELVLAAFELQSLVVAVLELAVALVLGLEPVRVPVPGPALVVRRRKQAPAALPISSRLSGFSS